MADSYGELRPLEQRYRRPIRTFPQSFGYLPVACLSNICPEKARRRFLGESSESVRFSGYADVLFQTEVLPVVGEGVGRVAGKEKAFGQGAVSSAKESAMTENPF